MQIRRKLEKIIEQHLFKGIEKKRAIVIYGPRQVGKTTLVKRLLEKHQEKSAFYNCDYADVQEKFAYKNAGQFDKLVRGLKLLVLDEAQRIENIGLVLKILVDSYPELQVVATGSSSFDLANKISEPLTGRKIELQLYPLSVGELMAGKNELEKTRLLLGLLRFGSYPVAVTSNEPDTEVYLKELVSSFLFKYVFSFQDLRKPELLIQLLRLLAFQVGQEVSYHELATQLKVDQLVIQRYLDLLEKSFVIFRLPAFSRNLRKEVARSRKIYFYDLGVRNTLIQNLNELKLRNDQGALWENFCLVERQKQMAYSLESANAYFWRTYDQKEIDYIEESKGKLAAYEFKWQAGGKVKEPKDFLRAYPGSSFSVVTNENYEKFVYTGKPGIGR